MANNQMALGSRPKNEYEKKLVGIVKIVTGDTKAVLTLQEEGKTFNNGTDSLKVLLEDLPLRPKLAPKDKTGKEYRIRMNSEGDTVEAITPVRGHFPLKLVDLGPRPEKNSDPMPFEKVFTKGDTENSHLEFFAVYEITDGAFKGVQCPAYWLHYKFEEDPENPGYTRFAGNFENKKATRLFQLRDWGLAHGLWDEQIEWDDDTILPELLLRATKNPVKVEGTFDKGYITLIQVPEDYDAPDESVEDLDEEEEAAPAQTYTTRAPKKIKASQPDDDDL